MAKAPRKDMPVRIDQDVLRLARIVAAYRGITISDYISERLRPLAEADLAKHQREQRQKGDD